MMNKLEIVTEFALEERIVVYTGDCLDMLKTLPDQSMQLIVTSPPYNIGKEYEKRTNLKRYIELQKEVIAQCCRVLSDKGSLCWQVGNFVDNGEIIPLDVALYPIFSDLKMKMRNRIVWHFEHGLHCSKRFSGRYETINWYTKTDDYVFNLDPVRVPQKYPGKKYFKGPKTGEYSGNPLGKNPGDLWVIPNVKSNHVEKTEHPCQYPVELVERLVLSMTNANDWVLDPYLGSGSSLIAAVRHQRKGIGTDMEPRYVAIAKERVKLEIAGALKTRPMNKPVYDPVSAGNSLRIAPWESSKDESQLKLLEKADKEYSE